MGSPATTPSLRPVSLDDKYDLSCDQVFVTGTQAVIRMLLMQQARDRAAGLDTAGFVSGYRGSPIGGLDQNLVRAKKVLDAANIVFQPGLNEELAATALWGSQQAEMRGEGRYDGVFGLWYGKGPGVDRSGDVFRHANMAGTSRHGGVLALMGDDHTAESSTVAHQSEFHFVDVMSPILNPAGVQEILDYGLYGYAMSRYCGTWVAFKCIKENIESTASVDARLDRVKIVLPDDFLMPPGGLNIRTPDGILEQEARLQDFKRDAMLAFVRANNLNRIVLSGGRQPKIGIITVGKSYLDVRQAMDDLGLDEVKANDMGLRLYKVACPWPLSRRELAAFADGLDLVMVVEEKRSLIEVQLREELYGSAHQPVCIGKRDEAGNWLFPVKGALDPNDIAVALGERLLRYHRNDDLAGRVARLKGAQERLAQTADIAARIPHFCAGCPHNSSTKVPDGMRAYAGIGCHYMAQWMDRETDGFTQMGGEGANWIGENAFSTRGHVFQNLGDGTYNHSGSLALRWAVDTGTTITYKILFNDAVAMTGGQPHEGGLTVDRIAAQVRAEGVERIALVTDEPDKYPSTVAWPHGLTIHHRDELDAVQRELATVPGVSVMIYDQTCASEKRRRRKRNAYPDPDKRVIINDLVCEGCGDCSVQSNCVAVQPVETEFGRKRRIDQSSCNKDFSCVKGFCPSFVTVHGAKPRSKPAGVPVTTDAAPDAGLPEPAIPAIDGTYNLIVTGVGGTGVVTVGAILGMAAHLEGKGLGMIDMAGLAQKGGAVFSHVRLANRQEDIHAIRVGAGAADLVLGCDLVVSGNRKVLSAIAKGRTHLVVNTAEVMPGEFTRRPDFSLPAERIKRAIREAAGAEHADFTDATSLAVSVLGNALAANMFMLGFAWQRGRVPLSRDALLKAIELNREAVAMNRAAFAWGRRAAAHPETMRAVEAPAPDLAPDLDGVIAKRVAFLTAYQDAAYAARYAQAISALRSRESAIVPGQSALTDAAARSLFRLMAYKDEYEVARLYTDGSFQAQVQRTFEGENLRYEFHLAPPLLARRDPATGRPRKMTFGPWMMTAFGMLARMKALRGTALDPFGYTRERREERRLVQDFEALLTEIARDLTPANHAAAVGLAGLPQRIRGYGPVKAKNLEAARDEEATLLARFRSEDAPLATAAE
ncbi:indolepyruvate ferredoxin oxidoreductase [Methylobacterium indicum]|uniref:indolepyruvate ferredoxin oxidoreductase family protein n=1 Tax=Methylobacterium indicum TaxID=1775910 RepID=UPI0007342CA9|nr:indolepyruvate ferredoxin oxidoreductase family protein [Methylobacterium indicum]KTS37347.1 indolepyruvate ferredoxin oxidoreductase [Methylobacterium indicum]KTS40666.1 indolepyruvate ferredoxin oxidoreductase [Methylobacterium indicum]KTS54426.1 indolepyruvate ferredoxin oxidoreductase [Methylobacterium indicum]